MRAGHKALTNATVTVKAFDPFCISVGKHELQVTLVDTPGYGETLHTEESFEVICSYVDSLFERQLRAESSWSARDAERMRLQDPLVHVCLYFVAPHRLKHIDIAFMRALHKKVNIVPIIAKSDTMTTKEKDEFKMQVREALKTEGIEAYPFDVSTLRAMEQQDKIEYRMPWAVIGSTDAYLDAGATVYLRKYPWGNALSSEPAHSDLPALRNMIMWSGQWHDLKMAARAKYEAWRCERPLRKRSSAALHILGRACVNKCRKAVDAVTRGRDAVVRAGASACVAVGVPPRYGARAFLILLLGLTAYAGPPAVRWATGTDLSAPHKLALARNQVERLVLEKSKLVEKYEKDLNALRLKLDNANGLRAHARIAGSPGIGWCRRMCVRRRRARSWRRRLWSRRRRSALCGTRSWRVCARRARRCRAPPAASTMARLTRRARLRVRLARRWLVWRRRLRRSLATRRGRRLTSHATAGCLHAGSSRSCGL